MRLAFSPANLLRYGFSLWFGVGLVWLVLVGLTGTYGDGSAFVFILSFFVGLFGGVKVDNLSLVAKMVPSLFILIVAMVAGVAASYTWVKPELHENLAGIAVTVTLIPPWAAIGLAAASANWVIFHNTLNLFLLNVFGIVVSSLIIFSLMDFYKAKEKMVSEVKEEEKAIKKAKKEILKTEIK